MNPAAVRQIALRLLPGLADERGVWLVGGAVRDHLLGRPVLDLDFAVAGEARALARRVADRLGADYYALDVGRDAGRVLWSADARRRRTLDFARLRGESIVQDLRARDFTINALAVPLHGPEVTLDPTGGEADAAQRVLRACTDRSIEDDPVRSWRAVRFAGELAFSIEPRTVDLLRHSAPALARVSAERLRDELFQILSQVRPGRGLARLAELGLLRFQPGTPPGVSSPALAGNLGVVDAAADLLSEIGIRPESDIPPGGRTDVGRLASLVGELQAHLDTEVSFGRTVRQWMYCFALLRAPERGAEEAREPPPVASVGARMRNLRLSRAEVDRAEAAVRALSLLAPGRGSPRPTAYRYFRESGPAGVDAGLLSLAASRLPGSDPEERRRRLDLVGELLEAYFHTRAESVEPSPLVDGETLISELGLGPGPLIGRLLEAIREAQAAGVVRTRAQAMALARREIWGEGSEADQG